MSKPWVKLHRVRTGKLMTEDPVDRAILTDMLSYTDDDGTIDVGPNPIAGLLLRMGSTARFRRLLPEAYETGLRIGMITFDGQKIAFASWERYQGTRTRSERAINERLTSGERAVNERSTNSLRAVNEPQAKSAGSLYTTSAIVSPREEKRREDKEERREDARARDPAAAVESPVPEPRPEVRSELDAWTAPAQLPDEPLDAIKSELRKRYAKRWEAAVREPFPGYAAPRARTSIDAIAHWAARHDDPVAAIDAALDGYFALDKSRRRWPLEWLAEDPGRFAEARRQLKAKAQTAEQRAERKRLADEAERAKRERDAAEAMAPDEIEAGMGQLISMIGRRL